MAGDKIKQRTEGILWVCDPCFDSGGRISAETDEPIILWNKTLIAFSQVEHIDEYRLNKGFEYLDNWDIVVPLSSESNYSYDEILDGNIRIKALQEIPDLRIPVIDISLIWWADNPKTKKVFELWQELDSKLNYSSLSLMIAIYRLSPLIMFVPANWISNLVGCKGKKVFVTNIAKYDLERAGIVFKAGHTKKIYMPKSLEGEIRSSIYLKVKEVK